MFAVGVRLARPSFHQTCLGVYGYYFKLQDFDLRVSNNGELDYLVDLWQARVHHAS